MRQPEGPDGPTTVQLTSDLATSAVLHWGVRRGTSRGEWLRPPDQVLPTPRSLFRAHCSSGFVMQDVLLVASETIFES